jgi:hypothetical protein
MAEQLPEVLVQRRMDLKADTTSVIVTFRLHVLAALLAKAGVEHARDLPADTLRDLCDHSDSAARLRPFVQADGETPEANRGIIVQTTIGYPSEESSALAQAFASDFAGVYAALNALYVSSFTTIDFELRVFDDPPVNTSVPWEDAGQMVLRGVLFPRPEFLAEGYIPKDSQ